MAPHRSTDSIGTSAMSKAMWRILPLILMAYVMAYMDRVNVSFAAIQMNVDLNFSATAYGLGGGLFFLGYALFEIPSGAMAVRFGPRQWLARIMVTWGLLAAGMMFIHTPLQFYLMRFVLGVAEAGFFPGLIYYFGGWFPTAFRGRALSRIYIAPALASVVMGSISGSLLNLDGVNGWQGWQWLFLAQGLPAVFMGLVLFRFLPDSPAAVTWLTDPEKAWIQGELARDAVLIGHPEHHDILATLAHPVVLLMGLTGFLANGVTVGLTLSALAILAAGAGLDTKEIGHLVSTGGIIGAVFILVAGWNSDRHGDRLRDAVVCTIAIAIGIGLIATGATPGIVITGYLLFAAFNFTQGVLLVSSYADVMPVRQLAVGCGAINTLWQFGALAVPFAFGAAKDATGNYHAGLLGSAMLAFVLAAYLLYVRQRVTARRAARILDVAALAI